MAGWLVTILNLLGMGGSEPAPIPPHCATAGVTPLYAATAGATPLYAATAGATPLYTATASAEVC